MRRCAFVVLAVLAASSATTAVSGAGYVTLNAPDVKNGATPSGINDKGQIVGTYPDTSGTELHGYLFGHGVRRRLDAPRSLPAEGGTFPCGINNRGDVVGFIGDAKFHNHGFLWHRGVFRVFDVPDAVSTEAFSLNDKGQIVGAFTDRQGWQHGFLLFGGVFTTLDHPLALWRASKAPNGTTAFGINARGLIVGTYYARPDGRSHGFLLRDGVYKTLDDPKSVGGTEARGINDAGDVVGTYSDRTALHGFLLRRGVYRTLDVPHAKNMTEPSGINNKGQVVGDYFDTADHFHGFVYSP